MTHVPLRTILAGLLAAALLAGCGDGSDEPSSRESAGQEQTSAAPSDPETSEESTSSASPSSDGTDEQGAPTREEFDAYLAAARKQSEDLVGTFNGLYSDVRIEPDYPVGIEYEFVFAEHVDPGIAKPQLNRTMSVLRETYKTMIGPELKRLGIAHPEVTWTYLNSDDSLIWTHTFTE